MSRTGASELPRDVPSRSTRTVAPALGLPSVSTRLRPFVVVLCLVVGCDLGEVSQRGQGPGGREQPLALSPAEELRVGRQAYEEALQEFRGKVLPSNHPDVRRVKGVVDRLAA